ncbi:MAG: hypothetical protein ACLFQV_08880 [Vulcanimicrobiota bacterium]
MNLVGGDQATLKPNLPKLPKASLKKTQARRAAVPRESIQTKQETLSPRERLLKRQKDQFTRTATDDQAPRTHQKKTQQVMNHFVSQTSTGKTAKKAQNQDAQKARDSEFTRKEEGGSQQPQSNVPLDNASRIGLMYQQKVRKKQQQKGKIQERPANAGQTQQGQLKKFLGNLRKIVKNEYQQYTRAEISTYSRGNLRDVMSALGENVKAFDNKAAEDRRMRSDVNVAPKFFNKHYAIKAGKNLKLFNEDPMNDPNYDPFEMIA